MGSGAPPLDKPRSTVFIGPKSQSFVLRRRLRGRPYKSPELNNPERSGAAFCERWSQRVIAASSISVVLGATLGTLESLAIPCLRSVVSSDIALSGAAFSTQDSVDSEWMALKLTACHKNQLCVPEGIIKCGRNGCSTQTYKRWKVFLSHLNIDLPQRATSTIGRPPQKRLASVAESSEGVGPVEDQWEAVFQEKLRKTLEGRSPGKSEIAQNFLRSNAEPMKLLSEDLSLVGTGGKRKIQETLKDLQKALQKATTSGDGLPLLTPLELQTLVIGCHTQCLISEIVAKIRATYGTRKATLAALDTCRRLRKIYGQCSLFTEQEWDRVYQKKDCDRYSLRFAEVTAEDVKKCLELTMQHIMENSDTLMFLSKVLQNRKDVRRNRSVASMVRDALKSALRPYRAVLSRIASYADVVRLCTLFQVAPPPLPALVRNRVVPVDVPENLNNPEELYHFCGPDIVSEVAETLGVLSRGAAILQLLRLTEIAPAAIKYCEMRLVTDVQNSLKGIPRDLLATTDLRDCPGFQNSILKNSYARDCLNVLFPEYLEFSETQIVDQMKQRFKTVIETVGLRIHKLVDQAVVCSMLIKQFQGIPDVMARRILKRLQQYGKELVLACDLIARKVNEMQLKSRERVSVSSTVFQLSHLHREKEKADRNASLEAVQPVTSGWIKPESIHTTDLTVPSASPLTSFPSKTDFHLAGKPSSREIIEKVDYRQSARVSGLAAGVWNQSPLIQAPPKATVLPHNSFCGTSSENRGTSGVQGMCASSIASTVGPHATNHTRKNPLGFLDLAVLKYRVHKMLKSRHQNKRCDKKNIWRPF